MLYISKEKKKFDDILMSFNVKFVNVKQFLLIHSSCDENELN